MSKKVPEYLPLSGLNLRGSVSPSTLESSCIKAAQDSEDPPPTRNTHPTGGGDAYLLTTYRTYPERWILLMTIFMLNVSTSVLWITYSAVSNIAADYFETSLSDINHLSVVYYLGYITFSLSASYVMHDRGLMSGLVIGAMLMVFSAWFRYLVVILPLTNMAKYYASLFAQIAGAIGQPFLLNAPTQFASAWFSATSRGSANTITSIASPFGYAVGTLIVPVLCHTPEELPRMLLVTAMFPTLSAIAIPFLRSTPPTPPGPKPFPYDDANRQQQSFFASLRDALSAPGFPVLLFNFASFVGVFTAFGALLSNIVVPYGYTNKQAGLMGAMTIVGGLLGAGIMGPLIDYTGWHVILLKILVPISAVCFVSMLWLVKFGSFIILCVLCFTIGISTFSLLPAALELGAECTYPVPEGTSTGLLWMTSNLFALIIQTTMDSLRAPLTANPPLNMLNAVRFVAGLAVVSALVGVFGFRGNLKRREAEKNIQIN